MQVYRIRHWDELKALAGDWNRLAAGVPFRTHEWLATWWQLYQPTLAATRGEAELFILAVEQHGAIRALAPWYIERSPSRGRVVRFLGTGEACSDYLGIMAERADETAVADALAEWLDRASRAPVADDNRWDILELAAMPGCEPLPALLADRLAGRGAQVHVRVAENTWRIALPDRWEAYLAMLSKSHRKQLRHLERRVFQSGAAVLRTAASPDELEFGWQILADLHQRRQRSLGKPGCFESPSFSQFQRAAADAFFRAGRLRLHWLELEGRPIAAEFQLAGDDTIFAYQGGIEPAALRHEPGRLIMLATLKRAIESGYRAFDFCRGDEPYKRHFRAAPCENLQWRIVSNRSTARLRQGIWQARRSARKWLKRGLVAARMFALG